MKPDKAINKALIYCRVSGSKQVREGDGLASQERRCREYADHKGYEVIDVFADDITGKQLDRPAMAAMLKYLHAHKRQHEHVVIIDDISRFARDLRAHLELRSLLANAGGKLESPSIEFGEDSDSVLIENLLASVAQHQREKNGEQTVNRMRARMMNGYWVFQAPIGFKYERVGKHGKLLVRHEPLASIITECLEGFASGRFGSAAEVKRYLETQPEFPRGPSGCVLQQKVTDMLSQPLYAGRISHTKWNLNLIEGHHKGLISLETYMKIQERRQKKSHAPTRKDIRADFPLRGFVCCADCNQPYTSCWSTGQYKKYPYYICYTKGCVSYRKSVRKEKLEGAFETMVRSMQPSANLLEIIKVAFKSAWDQRYAQAKHLNIRLKAQQKKTQAEINGFLDRIVEATNPSVIRAYEARIEKLEIEQEILKEKLLSQTTPKYTYAELIELCFDFLSSPWNLWESGQLALRRLLIKLAFTERLTYHRQTGYRTPVLSLPFRMLGSVDVSEKEMVPPAGAGGVL